MTKEELLKISLTAPDESVGKRVQANWDGVAKPLDGMGVFEPLFARIGAILGSAHMDIGKKAVIVMCADNGIVEEGVTQSGREVTRLVAESMGKRKSSVCKMAASLEAEVIPVDIGIYGTETIPGVLNRKVRQGTRNFCKEPAMTAEETLAAVSVGMELVKECKDKGIKLVATGEMGIGNTTTSSAVAAALLKTPAEQVTGRGAGLDRQGLQRKKQVIAQALDKYGLYEADAFSVLQTVGGLDIAGLVGVCLGGALWHMPIVLDGVISLAAALTAERLVPGAKDFFFASHRGKEPAVDRLTEALGLTPVIQGNLALGEGTGAVMLFSLLDLAACIYEEKTTFSDIKIEPYRRFLT